MRSAPTLLIQIFIGSGCCQESDFLTVKTKIMKKKELSKRVLCCYFFVRLKPIFLSLNYTALLILVLTMSVTRSEEHTSELQSRENLVCRLLLEKKKKLNTIRYKL